MIDLSILCNNRENDKIQLVVTAADLEKFASDLISADRQFVEKSLEPSYYSREELSQLLHVDKQTIQKYEERGLIKRYKVGNRVLYNRMETIEAIASGGLVKYKRKKKSCAP